MGNVLRAEHDNGIDTRESVAHLALSTMLSFARLPTVRAGKGEYTSIRVLG